MVINWSTKLITQLIVRAYFYTPFIHFKFRLIIYTANVVYKLHHGNIVRRSTFPILVSLVLYRLTSDFQIVNKKNQIPKKQAFSE